MSDAKDDSALNSTITPEGPDLPEPETLPAPIPSPYPNGWAERIGPFALEVSKGISDITTALAPLVGNAGSKALELLSNEVATPDSDLKEAFQELKIPKALLNTSLHLLRGPKKAPANTVSPPRASLLPAIPDNTSFLKSLKIQGDLKVDPTKVYALVRTALAQRAGLYGILDKVAKLMEEQAQRIDTPCGQEYYDLLKTLRKRDFSEVLEIFNLQSHYVTLDRRQRLFSKLPPLWDAISQFHAQLHGWYPGYLVYLQSFGNQNPLLNLVAGLPNNNVGFPIMPAIPPPETSGLRDQAEVVITAVNRVFAGDSLPIVNALAYEATNIGEVLSDPHLPILTGKMTREIMLRDLDVGTTSNDVRQEQGITQYVAAILNIPNIIEGQEELRYFMEMWQLGNSLGGEIIRKTTEIQLAPAIHNKLPNPQKF